MMRAQSPKELVDFAGWLQQVINDSPAAAMPAAAMPAAAMPADASWQLAGLRSNDPSLLHTTSATQPQGLLNVPIATEVSMPQAVFPYDGSVPASLPIGLALPVEGASAPEAWRFIQGQGVVESVGGSRQRVRARLRLPKLKRRYLSVGEQYVQQVSLPQGGEVPHFNDALVSQMLASAEGRHFLSPHMPDVGHHFSRVPTPQLAEARPTLHGIPLWLPLHGCPSLVASADATRALWLRSGSVSGAADLRRPVRFRHHGSADPVGGPHRRGFACGCSIRHILPQLRGAILSPRHGRGNWGRVVSSRVLPLPSRWPRDSEL